MDMKKVLAGVVASSVLGVASADSVLSEKQTQAEVMSKLLDGFSVVMVLPECTVKTVLDSLE